MSHFFLYTHAMPCTCFSTERVVMQRFFGPKTRRKIAFLTTEKRRYDTFLMRL